MNPEKFALILIKKPISLSHDWPATCLNGMKIDVPHEFKAMVFKSTEQIDYRCNFKNGSCKNLKHTEKCCCHGCSRTVGYLQHMSFADFDTCAELYNDEDGYWRPSGCALPREMRSLVCIRHLCPDYDDQYRIIHPPLRSHVLLRLLDHLGDTLHDYLNFSGAQYNQGNFTNYVNAWTNRIAQQSQPSLPFTGIETAPKTWRKYHNGDYGLSKSKTV